MTFKEKLEAKASELKELNEKMAKGDIEAAAKSAEVRKEMDDLAEAIKAAEETEKRLSVLGTVKAGKAEVSEKAAKSLGEHFVQNLKKASVGTRFDVVAPEFKAASNIFTDTGSVDTFPMGSNTQDYRVVEGARARSPAASSPSASAVGPEGARAALQIRDLFDAQTISTAAYSYFTEGALGTGPSDEGIAEGAEKTPVTYNPFNGHVAVLTKIAGYIKESDEFIADYPFLVSAINGRLLYDLRAAIQSYLLTTLLGAGIQTDTASWDTSTTVTGLADIILESIMDVQSSSGRAADAVVINPADWYALRIGKDGDDRYYGGGYFQDGLTPAIWGLPAIVTASIPAGTILVGAFKQGATVLSNGGVQVEATNSNEDDFVKNLMTIRAEERLALAVRVPLAFKSLVKGS